MPAAEGVHGRGTLAAATARRGAPGAPVVGQTWPPGAGSGL